jgi:glycosyltransferase involved in cell wall biosynthesis
MTASVRDVLVVVPTLGERPETLGDALASVTAQRDVRTHLVVVVPAAAEDARETARQHGATVVDDPRTGLSGAVNAGIAARRDEGSYAWIGDDDLLAEGGLARLAELLERDTRAVVAHGGCAYIDPEGRRLGVSAVGRLAPLILPWGPDLVPQPASLTRMEPLLAAGPYDEDLGWAMDLDMFLRLRRLGRFVSTREVTASFRWHPDSLTVANRARSLAESEAVKHRYLSPSLRRVAPLWDVPVRAATRLAARRVNARARAVAEADRHG